MADLLFAVLLSDLDQELHRSLQAAGFIAAQPRLDFQTGSLDGQEPLPSIIWADDMAIPQSFCSPSELYFRLPDLCRIVFEVFASYGMQLSSGSGKTEIILRFVGSHVKAWSHRLFDIDQGFVTFPFAGESIKINVPKDYVHLGSGLDSKGKLHFEISRRTASSREPLRLLRPQLLRSRSVSSRTKLQAVRSLALSRLLYGVESWLSLTLASFRMWSSAVIAIYRSALPRRLDCLKPLAKDEVLSQTFLPDPSQLLALSRLRFLGQLVQFAPQQLWSFIFWEASLHSDSWADLVNDDLAWLQRHVPLVDPCPAERFPSHSWLAWLNMVGAHWHGKLKKTNRSPVRYRVDALAWLQWRTHFFSILEEAGLVPPVAALPSTLHCCDLCDASFASVKALALHCAHKHGWRAAARAFCDGPVCHACGMNYRSRPRCLRHLEYRRTGCLTWLMQVFAPMPQEEQIRFDKWDLHQKRAARADPLLRRELALPCTREFEPAADLRRLLPIDKAESQQAVDREIVQHRDHHWMKLKEALVEDSERAFAVTASSNVLSSACSPRPVPGTPVYLVLHLFNGQRKHGDLQHWLEHFTVDQPFRLLTLSLDVAIDPVHGNLADADTLSFWCTLLREHFVHSLVASPPHSTWAVARHREQAALGEDGEPLFQVRPIRSAMSPFGLWSLTDSEEKYLFSESESLRAAFSAAATQVASGHTGIIAHPSVPDLSECASIWKLPYTKALLAFPAVKRLYVEQGQFGQVSRKGTHLLSIALPDLESSFQQLAQPMAISKNSVGWNSHTLTCRTEALKAYPSRFSMAMARSIVHAAVHAHKTGRLRDIRHDPRFARVHNLYVGSIKGAMSGDLFTGMARRKDGLDAPLPTFN